MCAALKLSKERKDKVRELALADLNRAESYYKQSVEPLLLKRRAIYQADKDYYRRMFPRLNFSDYTSHDFYAWVQWALAQALDSFFGTTKVISIVGQGQGDAENAEVMEELLKWQIEKSNKGFLLYSTWFEDALIYDLGILKCWWSRSTSPQDQTLKMPRDRLMLLAQTPGIQIVSVSEPDFFGDVEVVVRQMITTENRPVLDHVSPFDLRWLPEARKLDESLFVAQRQLVTGDLLMRGARTGVYDKDEVKNAIDEAGITYEESDLEQNPDLDNYPSTEEDNARRRVELYECYLKTDINNDGVLENLIVTLAGDRLLRVEENPFGRLPYFVLTTQHDTTQVLPASSMADIEGELQSLRTAMVRQILLNISVNNRPRTFIDETSVNIDDLVNDKEFVRCNGNPNQSIQPAQVVQIAPWTMNFIEYFRSVEEEWTGRTRYNQGTDANTLNKTATGISLIMKSSAQRINHIVKIFAETGVGELERFLIRLNQLYVDQTQVIRLLDRPLEIHPDDLEGNFDIVVNSDVGLGEKEQRINVLTSYLKELYPYAMQLGIAQPEDFSRAAIRLLETLGWKDARRFMRTPEEIQQIRQQQQLQQMQQQMQLQSAMSNPQAAGQMGAQAGAQAAMQAMSNGQQG